MVTNNVNLIGRLTKDIELKKTQSGLSCASITLAINRNFKNQNGEYDTDFINCVVWRQSAEYLDRFAKKGMLIGLNGSIQTRTYDDRDGKKVYVTEVVANDVTILEKKEKEEKEKTAQMSLGGKTDVLGFNQVDISTDELPFY